MRTYMQQDALQKLYAQSLELLETVGIRFENSDDRTLLQHHGAMISGETVKFPSKLIEDAITTVPKPATSQDGPKRMVASTPFGTAPFILDDITEIPRRCNLDDAIRFYQINETSPLYECTNPGCADPLDNDGADLFVAQIAMALKYSDKYPSFGLRATASTALHGDVYGSACRAFRLVREFYDIWDEPVMTQSICPSPPLCYDRECLDNLHAAIDEGQAISITACSVGFLTAPESIMGIVAHDFALALAGLVYIQLKAPGHPVSFCEFSSIANVRTLQPNYGSPESVFIQVIFYELSRMLAIPCSISGGYGDGTRVDYQAGLEAMLTAMMPFNLIEINEVWCTPGILAGFACGSFHKAILDEEMMRVTNRMLQGNQPTPEPKLTEMIDSGMKNGSFLGVGRMKTYHRDNYMTQVFNKWGLSQAENPIKSDLSCIAQDLIEKRIESYILPDRTKAQMNILQPHLPNRCRY
jgi:trimethylamine---corrinoid protein Co-methyltransferase